MNIAKILRGCPSGTRLYSPIYGELSLVNVQLGFNEPICCRVVRSGNVVDFAEDGKCNKTDAEPTLFPSECQRDWSKFRLHVKNGDIGFSDDTSKYRIKPEPTYRPFKDKEECWEEMQKHQPFGWVCNNTYYRHINNLFTNSISFQESEIAESGNFESSLSYIFENYTFADGTPFGIKENE